MRIRRYFRIATILILLGVMAGAEHFAAQPAGAKSVVCTAARDVNFWCMNLFGSGGNVKEVVAKGNKYNGWDSICDYRAEVRISGNGNPKYAFYTNSSNGGCSWGYAANTVRINRTFPKGFYVCTKYFVGNQQQGREICSKLT